MKFAFLLTLFALSISTSFAKSICTNNTKGPGTVIVNQYMIDLMDMDSFGIKDDTFYCKFVSQGLLWGRAVRTETCGNPKGIRLTAQYSEGFINIWGQYTASVTLEKNGQVIFESYCTPLK